MPDSCFPLRDRLRWVYAATDPVGSRVVTVVVHPPVEIDAVDMATHEVRRERAWVVRQSGRETPSFAVEREHGVEILDRRRFGEPTRQALVVTSDLRWGGDPTWSRPYWGYGLQTRRYRRTGEEEEVTVTGGLFRCLKILLDEGEAGTVWLAPGVGIVREVSALEGLYPTRYSVLELLGPPGVETSPATGVEDYRQCARCGQPFREAENGDSACLYHGGRFLDYDKIGQEGTGAPGDFWDCCMRQVEDGMAPRDVPPCASGRHVERLP